jgi:hypothetical protein
MNHAEHQHAGLADGVARAQLSKLFFGRLDNPSATHAITGGVCYCCKTSIATGADGSIHAAWRHVYPGNLRDIAFASSTDGGRTFSPPIRVSEDKWMLDACPENGPALTVDAARRVHIVWPTLVQDARSGETLALFYAMSKDGRQFTPRRPLPVQGFARHPQMAFAASGEIMVAWDEQQGSSRKIAFARAAVNNTGEARFVRQPLGDEAPATYPAIATVESGAIVAWTSGPAGQTMIRTQQVTVE